MNWKTILICYSLAGICGFLLARSESRRPRETAAEPMAAKSDRREPSGAGKAASYRPGGDRWERLLLESGIHKPGDEPVPTYYLLGNDGEISEEKLRPASLSSEQESHILTALRESREAMPKIFAENVKRDPRQPKGTEGEIWYVIPHDLQRGQAVFGRLERDFVEACGKEKAVELARALNPVMHYGYFGRQDIYVKWRKQPVNGQVQWVGHWDCYDGPTGQEVVGGVITSEQSLRHRFGDVIPWPEEETK